MFTHKALLLYSLGAIVGIISGIVAGLYKMAIAFLSSLCFLLPETIGIIGWVFLPAMGALISGIMVIKFAPEAEGHGIPGVMESYAVRKGNIRFRTSIVKALASIINIGSGGSCGSEGPIGQIGSGSGSVDWA